MTAFAWNACHVKFAALALAAVWNILHDIVHSGRKTGTRRLEPWCAFFILNDRTAVSQQLQCGLCGSYERTVLCCRWSSYFEGPDRLKLDSEEELPIEQPEQNGSHMEGAAKMNGVSQAVDKLSIH